LGTVFSAPTTQASSPPRRSPSSTGQLEIGTLHRLQALGEQPQRRVPQLLGRMRVDVRALAGAATIEQEQLPRVAGAGEAGVSRALDDMMRAAQVDSSTLC
jgi:hypothetical protein